MNTDLDRVINSAKKRQSNPNEKNGEAELSFRIQLNLQPELDKGPEFSYLELMQQAKKTKKELLKSFDEEDDDEEENQRIARYFENKYSSNNKMINKNRVRDLHDAGLGYDETDPFVDNSECYDEVVPHSLTTKLGGFYINTGVLEFRQVSDSSTNQDTLPLDDCDSDDDSIIGNYRKNKKHATLADESDEDFKKDEKAERKRTKSRETEGEKRRKIDSNLKSAKKQSKVRQLVKKAKEQKYNSTSAKKNLKNSLEFLECENSQRSRLNNNQQENGSSEGNFLDVMDISGLTAENDPLHSNNIPSFANNNLEKKHDMNAFFQSLPGHLKEKVVNLQKVAKNNEKEGKVRFFSPELNKCLLDLELQLQSFHGRSKSSLIQLLTSFVPCSKETLVKRMKRLVTSQQEEILQPAISQLGQAVEKDMVVQIKKYQELCHAQLMAKSDQIRSDHSNNNTAAANSDNDDNCASNTNSTNAANNGEERTKRTYAPRRKFQWSDTTRALFYRVVQLKLDLFDQTKGKEKITVSEYLKNFFENPLKDLWPKLWMQSRTLYKESRKIHQHLTNDKPPKKQLQSATGGGVLPSASAAATTIESGKKSNGQQFSVNKDDDLMTPAQLAALLPSINDVRKGKLNKLKASKEQTVAKAPEVTQHQPKKVAKKTTTTTTAATSRLPSDDTPMPPPSSTTSVVQNKVYPSLENLTITPSAAPVTAHDKPAVSTSKPSFPTIFNNAAGETSNHYKNLTAAAAAQNLKNKTAEILNKKVAGAASELLSSSSSSSSVNLSVQHKQQKQLQKSVAQQRQQPNNTGSVMKPVNTTTTTTSTQQKQQQLSCGSVVKTSTPQQPAKKAPAATQKAKHSQQQQQLNDFSLDLLKLFSTPNLLAPQSTPTQADLAQYAAASQFLSPAATAAAPGVSDPLSANDLTSIANFFMYQNPISLANNPATAAKQNSHQPPRPKPTQQQQQARKSTEKPSNVAAHQNKYKPQTSQQAMTPTNKLNSGSVMASKQTTNSGGTPKLPQTTTPARISVTAQYKNRPASTAQYNKYQEQHNAAFKDPLPMQLQHKQQQQKSQQLQQQRKNSSEPSSPSYKRQQPKPSPSSSYHSYASHYHPTSSTTPTNSYRHHPYHRIQQQAAVSMFPSIQLSPTKPQQQASSTTSSHHFNPHLHHTPSPSSSTSSSNITHHNRKSADSYASSYPLPGATVSSPFGDRFAISNFLNLNTNKQPQRLHHGSSSDNHHKAESGPK